MNVKVILEPSEDGGYTAIVPGLPGCISEGDTKEEALANIKEAIQLYIEALTMISPQVQGQMWWRSPYDKASECWLREGHKSPSARWLGGGTPEGQPHQLHKHTRTEPLKLSIPAHRPIKRSTRAHILKQARLTVEEFEALL